MKQVITQNAANLIDDPTDRFRKQLVTKDEKEVDPIIKHLISLSKPNITLLEQVFAVTSNLQYDCQ